ncbi:T9SS type A sorting domain-containing protein [Porphyromonas circumdentaria]|uniref:Por secretion system C-terminal sorting domain-containing protein n=1 Tax=Porphyromonas circumdentaria TaxID=29524 RepID=A0A1T4KQA8_9PORP|nr:T9SS type A sorting domain-containing protein [Porphyromonas circumdentaria]MBB6274947.1 hypothetical protein [Porphyromonas circumdentaria]MDO4722221.1 T9SS type A sorting domain-containing protein [Porphyromonas circumdentaria]SJZ44591.1 Por secretion system C-terminal sorting domain-containing protein [Porphyromonas circumdentaria]
MRPAKLLSLSLLTVFTLCLQAQSSKVEVLRVGIPWSPQGISPNGRFISGTRQYEEAYFYDTETKKLHTQACQSGTSQLVFFDVSDDGTVVGKTDDGHPATYKNGNWTLLPTPSAPFGDASAVYIINSDGSRILGQVAIKPDGGKPYEVVPSLWERVGENEWKHTALPVPPKDFLNEGAPQFVSPRQMSEDGKTIVGLIINQTGKYMMQILYERQEDGSWEYSLPFLSVFCDMSKYQELKALEPDFKKMVTAKPGSQEYFQQIESYNKAFAKWDYMMKTNWLTGNEVLTLPILMSENGKYIASAWMKNTYSYEEGSMEVQKKQEYHPTLYNIKDKTFTHFPALKGYAPLGVTNKGNMICTDNIHIYIIDVSQPDKVYKMPDWIKEKYNVDIMAFLPENTKYMKSPIINGEGNLIACKYITAHPDNSLDLQDIFCVRITNDVAVEKVEQNSLKVHPNPTKGIVKIEGATPSKELRVMSMQGELLLSSQTDLLGNGTIDLTPLASGAYLIGVKGEKSTVLIKE